MGNGISENVNIRADSVHIAYGDHAVAGPFGSVLLPVLQNLMRGLERRLVADMTETGALIVVDGLLSFPLTMFSLSTQPVFAFVKTHHCQYLDQPDHLALLHRLESGSRRPVFQFGEGVASRYSWYVCLAPRRAIKCSPVGVGRLRGFYGKRSRRNNPPCESDYLFPRGFRLKSKVGSSISPKSLSPIGRPSLGA